MITITLDKEKIMAQLLKLDFKPTYNYRIINNAVYINVYDAIIRNLHKTVDISSNLLDSITLFFFGGEYMKIKNIPPDIMENLNDILF